MNEKKRWYAYKKDLPRLAMLIYAKGYDKALEQADIINFLLDEHFELEKLKRELNKQSQ
ncbi:MAG TPA: hypothetical protein VF596_16270 [Pyrinomonadaceae bacterium]|jgi:hypothetical protein